jgi:hypothetical protein
LGLGNGEVVDCGAGLFLAVYAWVPGQQSLQFVDGGLRTGADRFYMLEIHYNNEAGLTDVADESGVRVFLEARGDTELDMLTLGPQGFSLPANTVTQVDGNCPIQTEMTVIASLPHMHEIGRSLKSTIIRADGTEEDLITLQGWDFNTQFFYDTAGVTLYPGDRVETSCVFENGTDEDRRFGPYTEDEMCYNFLYVTPPPAERYCDQGVEAPSEYTPGACAPDSAAEIADIIRSQILEGTAPPATGGNITPGLYRLVAQDAYVDSANVGPATLDLAQSYGEMAGVFSWDADGAFAIDVSGVTRIVTSTGTELERPVTISSSGTAEDLDIETGQFTMKTTCPMESTVTQFYSATETDIYLRNQFTNPAPGTVILHFQKVSE